MADRKKKYSLDNILPEREETFESFYQAIASCGSKNPENNDKQNSNIFQDAIGKYPCNK